MRFFFLIIIISLLSSCSFKDKEALQKVEQLNNKVNALQRKFESVDYEKVTSAKKQYNESIGLIKKYYFKDTIDVQFMNSLDYYKNIKYSSKIINKNKDIIKDNFSIVNHQLSILKEDLNNTAIQGDKLEEALINESNNVAKLDSAVILYIENVEILLNVHDSIAGYIKNQTLSF